MSTNQINIKNSQLFVSGSIGINVNMAGSCAASVLDKVKVKESRSRSRSMSGRDHVSKSNDRSKCQESNKQRIHTGEASGANATKGVPVFKTSSTEVIPAMAVQTEECVPRKIDLETALKLKNLSLGSGRKMFPSFWLRGYTFIKPEEYILEIPKAELSNIITPVQGFLLKEILASCSGLDNYKHLERSQKNKLLSMSLSRLIFGAGNGQKACLVLIAADTHMDNTDLFIKDEVTERTIVYTFLDIEKMALFLETNIHQYTSLDCPGFVLVMYSVMLTKSCEMIFDEINVSNVLLTDSFEASSELLLLYLCGSASTSATNYSLISKTGIKRRTDIGFLTNNLNYQVGSNLKTPKFPIWVNKMTTHSNVVISTDKSLLTDWKNQRHFYILVVDGLLGLELEAVISTITASKSNVTDDPYFKEIEESIRSKWNFSSFEWKHNTHL